MPRTILALFVMLSSLVNAQTFIPFYNQVAGQVSQANINQTLTEFQASGSSIAARPPSRAR